MSTKRRPLTCDIGEAGMGMGRIFHRHHENKVSHSQGNLDHQCTAFGQEIGGRREE